MEHHNTPPSSINPRMSFDSGDKTPRQSLDGITDKEMTSYQAECQFRFRDLPLELRLRVLQHTHLGPPETGDYDPRFERLVIRDGKLIPGIFDFAMLESQIDW